jgi:hypothetical protein
VPDRNQYGDMPMLTTPGQLSLTYVMAGLCKLDDAQTIIVIQQNLRQTRETGLCSALKNRHVVTYSVGKFNEEYTRSTVT